MLPAEISLGGVYVPGLLVLAAGLFVLFWLLDGLAGRLGLYRYAWHPPLFRLGLYVCVFGLMGLALLN
ncbi:DUF1656 domain-containing protein [Pseudoxanthomonas composti]|uniref:DUF1656 domain-containing protein n=1 Tax=Pseudoxanthomonas composti TaxID=2137479 RepID=A0A4Q1JTE5_9GAMM|nr:DUF1656 domain-containing protein [Pseudoxanthomonas composti]RXR04266.1 DUF1656 domain-containing protein [Pseudoxanthomonas composti]